MSATIINVGNADEARLLTAYRQLDSWRQESIRRFVEAGLVGATFDRRKTGEADSAGVDECSGRFQKDAALAFPVLLRPR